jgi:hypothetical protein
VSIVGNTTLISKSGISKYYFEYGKIFKYRSGSEILVFPPEKHFICRIN